jgi:ATP-binding cassette subfamily F protein 3
VILACRNIKKSFGSQTVLDEVSFHIEDGEKCAVIGVNGAGKTTLFRIITGEEQADEGEVVLAKGRSIGYLQQATEFVNPENTVYEELKAVFADLDELESKIRDAEKEMARLGGAMLEKALERYNVMVSAFEARDGYARESRLKGVIKGLCFDDEELNLPVKLLSGGRKTRAGLGKLLLSAPDLLLLDEPTNHLDISSVTWFEDVFIKNYAGAVLIISHDRYFLDKTVKKVVEIEYGKAKMYGGNYTSYALKKEADRAVAIHHYLVQQKEITRQEGIIKQLRSYGNEIFIKRAKSREKMLAKMDRLDKPTGDPEKMRFFLEPTVESGNDVLSVRGVSKRFGDNLLFEDVSFEIKKGDIAALIGPNGIGKSTLLKMIYGREPYGGRIDYGTNVKMGFYDQEHTFFDGTKTIFREMADSFPKLTNTRIRNILAAFMFKNDDVFKLISALSGGEKGRVALAKLMLGNVNFILLDEPTNHLDMFSKEILEQALRNYSGTVLYVSHDRYFINNTAERIIEMTGDTAAVYEGNYDYYIEKKTGGAEGSSAPGAGRGDGVKVNSYKAKKEEEAAERKRSARVKRIEAEIADIEKMIREADERLARDGASADAVMEEYDKKAKLEERLEEMYSEWESCSITDDL